MGDFGVGCLCCEIGCDRRRNKRRTFFVREKPNSGFLPSRMMLEYLLILFFDGEFRFNQPWLSRLGASDAEEATKYS